MSWKNNYRGFAVMDVYTGRALVKCKAVDDKRFKHTLAPEKEASTDSRLIEDFKHYFGSAAPDINTKERVLALVNVNKEVRDWYKKWSLIDGQSKSFPDWLDRSKVADIEAYAKLEADRATLQSKEKNWQTSINNAAKTLKDTVASVDTERKTYYAKLPPLLQISLVTVNNLPLDKAATYAQATSENRAEVGKAQVLAYQKELKQSVDAGTFKSPF